MNSSNMIKKFPEVLNFNQLFLKLNRFVCGRVSPFIGVETNNLMWLENEEFEGANENLDWAFPV